MSTFLNRIFFGKRKGDIEAANNLENQLMEKELRGNDLLEELKSKAGEVHFVFEGRVFVPILKRCNIPGLGKRTAIEICVDTKAQEYLVKNGCIGSVITEIK